MPDTRPRIGFDEHGVCNACRNAEEKDRIDWDNAAIDGLMEWIEQQPVHGGGRRSGSETIQARAL